LALGHHRGLDVLLEQARQLVVSKEVGGVGHADQHHCAALLERERAEPARRGFRQLHHGGAVEVVLLEVHEAQIELPPERLRDHLLGDEAQVDERAPELAPRALLLLEREPELLLRDRLLRDEHIAEPYPRGPPGAAHACGDRHCRGQISTPGRPLQFSNVHEYLLRARQLLSRGALAEAEALAREVLQEPEAHHLLGLIQQRRGELAGAETALRQAIARDGRVAAYHHALGNVLQDRGKLKDAIACYRRALRLQPALAAAWNDLGTARYAQEEFEAAVECYQQAVRLRPGHAVAHANLGAVYRKLGLLSEARRALQRELWLRLKGFFTPWRRNEAREQLESGNAPLAAEIAERTRAFAILCAARLQQGRFDEALEAARKANDPLALARTLAALGKIDEAAGMVQTRSIPAEPRNAPLHLALGDFQHRKKIYDAA